MKHILFIFLTFLLFASILKSDDNLVQIDKTLEKTLEGQVIKIILDNIESDELTSDKLGVIIFQNFAEENFIFGDFIAWFRYNCDDEYITINYHSFPLYEKFSEWFDKSLTRPGYQSDRFSAYIQKFIQDKKIIDIEDIKQVKIPLPIGLKNDTLFYEMHKIYNVFPIESKVRYFYDGTPYIPFIHIRSMNPNYYWGIKSGNIKLIRYDLSYQCNTSLNVKITLEILNPIKRAVLSYETPLQWKKDFWKWKKEKERNLKKSKQEEAENIIKNIENS